MIKKILLITLFCFFLIRPVPSFAQFEPESTTSSQIIQSNGQVLGVLDDLGKLLMSLFQVITGMFTYVTKDYEVLTSDTRNETNQYDREDKDYGARVSAQDSKDYRQGVWFNEVLTTHKYKDEIINKNDRDCGEIVISELVYYFYKKGEKILYERSDPHNPIDYNPSILKVHSLKKADSCYINARSNIQDVPRGTFNVSTEDPELDSLLGAEGGAAAASTQINQSVRTPVPNNYQGEDAPDDNDTDYKVRRLIQDTDKQEETMILHFIPEKNKNLISCNDNATLNRDNLRYYFECVLNPNSWTKYKCKDINLPIDITNVGCGEKNAKDNPVGVSQRGAHGLGLSGYLYRDIMKLYLGNNIYFDEDRGVDDKNLTVIMIDDTDFNKDGVSDNDANCQALVNKQYADWYDKPDLYSGSGGYTQVDKEWVKCEEAGIYEKIQKNLFDFSGPNYTLTGDCYPAVRLSIHYYLLGIAEISHNWHLEALKALTLTHRYTALTDSRGDFIKNNSDAQVFQCNEVLHNDKTGDEATNLGIAVELTRDELAYNLSDKKMAYATARTAFCGPGSNNPSFDGFKYEKISYVASGIGSNQTINTLNNISGICFEGIGYTFANKDITQSPNSSSLQAYQYNQAPQVLGQTSNPVNQSSPCLLDNRLFSSLDQLISAFNSQNPSNHLNFISCYRSTKEQETLWQQYLSENKGDQLKTISQINYPGTSPHQTGLAIDFGDKFGKLSTQSSSYKWLVSNASRFGFYHHQLEPEHWEYKP